MRSGVVMKSNLVVVDSQERKQQVKVESGSSSSADKNLPVCPKPRRLVPPIPELLNPIRCTTNHRHDAYQPNSGGRSGILNMVDGKTYNDGHGHGHGHGHEHESSSCTATACSPSCYSGSPPGRTDNPLVHDVHFLHQMDLLSPLSVRTKFSDKFSYTSPASPF